MRVPGDKKVVCLTGNVWTGVRSLDPRRLLSQNGFTEPVWFTTGLPTSNQGIYTITVGEFQRCKLEDRILAHVDFGGDRFGILKSDLETAVKDAREGGLIVGPQDIVAQVADTISQAIIFTLKAEEMSLSRHLDEAGRRGQLHRIDVNSQNPRSWTEAWNTMQQILGLSD